MMSFMVTSNLIMKPSQVNASITQGSTIVEPNNSRQARSSQLCSQNVRQSKKLLDHTIKLLVRYSHQAIRPAINQLILFKQATTFPKRLTTVHARLDQLN